MSKADILDQLPKLSLDKRFQIFSFLWELDERDFFSKQEASEEEKYLLDQADEDYQANSGSASFLEEVRFRVLHSKRDHRYFLT